MVAKKRIRQILLKMVRFLRIGKTELPLKDALSLAETLEALADQYCPNLETEERTFPMYINGQIVNCLLVHLPPKIAWLKRSDNIYEVNIKCLEKLIKEGKDRE
jgi:hypothetical protein